MDKPLVIVTGANGQLGKELRRQAEGDNGLRFLFFGRDDMPIENFELVRQVFRAEAPAFCINCAAYTAVDKAESEKDAAFLANAEAPGVLAKVCQEHGTRFMHVSTDYVFNGKHDQPYREEDPTGPINVYGASKLEGEQRVMASDPDAIILRTSWVYSEFGKNFVKTMIMLMKDRPSINVVDDQWGSPTYAADLARDILAILHSGKWEPGIYHYSNDAAINWHQFAVAIKELAGSDCVVNPIPASQYPTPASRPAYGVMSKEKFIRTWGIAMQPWKKSLSVCMDRLGALK